MLKPIQYLYIGLFDGHGGPGAAIKASKELHQIVHEGLEDVIEYLIRCDLEDLELEINKEENIGKCFIVSIFITAYYMDF